MKKIEIITVCDNPACGGELRDRDFRYVFSSPYEIKEDLEFCCGRCFKEYMQEAFNDGMMVADMFKDKGFTVIYNED